MQLEVGRVVRGHPGSLKDIITRVRRVKIMLASEIAKKDLGLLMMKAKNFYNTSQVPVSTSEISNSSERVPNLCLKRAMEMASLAS